MAKYEKEPSLELPFVCLATKIEQKAARFLLYFHYFSFNFRTI